MDLKQGKDEPPLKTRKCLPFLYPEAEWTQVCTEPDVTPYSTNLETCSPVTFGNGSLSSSHAIIKTDATPSKPDDSSVSRCANTVQQTTKSPLMTNRVVSGRKRKMHDGGERKARSGNIKRTRTRLTPTASGVHDAKTPSPVNKVHAPVCYETDMMRFGRMLGYNVVQDYNNYIVVRSAYGYGNISQSSGMTRNLETVCCSQTANSIRQSDNSISLIIRCKQSGKKTSPEDRDNQLVKSGRHRTIDISNYLVVQSVAGYGNISQSGGAKRIVNQSEEAKRIISQSLKSL